MGNHNRYIEEEQTTQWPNKKFKEANNDLHNGNTKSSPLSLCLSLSLSLSRGLRRFQGNYEMVRRSSPFSNRYDSPTQNYKKDKLT